MPAGGKASWDGNPNTSPPTTAPYRPGTADFNGLGITDDLVNAPNAATMPTANLLNSWSAFAVVFGRMIPNLTLSVRYAAGAPVLDSFTAAPTGVIAGNLTVARTGGGAVSGDISITWPAGTFPAALTQPKGSMNGILPGMIAVSAITNGIRVVTLNSAAAIADIPFTADLM